MTRYLIIILSEWVRIIVFCWFPGTDDEIRSSTVSSENDWLGKDTGVKHN